MYQKEISLTKEVPGMGLYGKLLSDTHDSEEIDSSFIFTHAPFICHLEALVPKQEMKMFMSVWERVLIEGTIERK